MTTAYVESIHSELGRPVADNSSSRAEPTSKFAERLKDPTPSRAGSKSETNGSETPPTTRQPTASRNCGTVVGYYISLFFYLVFLLPYSVFCATLLVLSLGEYFIRLCTGTHRHSSEGHSFRFGDLALVKAERTFRQGVWRVLNFNIGDPTPEFRENLWHAVFPSSRIQDSEDHKEYVARYRELEDGIKMEIEDCRQLLQKARKQRQLLLKETVGMEPYDETRLKLCSGTILETETLGRHLENLQKELNNIEYIALTQAVLDKTGYRGLADWAQKAFEGHKDLVEALYQVSFVGAGLTYSTIFGATRGNIGLMCYAFALFNCGFLVPLVTLALLKWAAGSPQTTLFASPHFWSIIMNGFIYLSVIAVVSAICVLNVTIILLHFSSGDGSALTDSDPQLNIHPKPAGYFALVCAAATVAVTLFAFFMHYMANGWDTLRDAFLSEHKGVNKGQKFNDYILR